MTNQYWIPRVRVMFRAEDPRVFSQRITNAFQLRKDTEALLRYNLYIDCMPMDGVGELDQASLKRMIECARGSPGLSKDKGYILKLYFAYLTDKNCCSSEKNKRCSFIFISNVKPNLYMYIYENALNIPGTYSIDNRLEDYLQVLEKEVNIDFCRSMNRIIFDQTVEEDPHTFAFVTKPEKPATEVPEKGQYSIYIRCSFFLCRLIAV